MPLLDGSRWSTFFPSTSRAVKLSYRAEFTYIHTYSTAAVFYPFMPEINQGLTLRNHKFVSYQFSR